MDWETVIEQMEQLSEEWMEERKNRLYRKALDKQDFKRIAETGFLLSAVPKDQGGLWENLQKSTRPICEMIRRMAHWDASIALVSCMHTSVLIFWLNDDDAPKPFSLDWKKQRAWIFETVQQGHWWGTITSEPGSGGDMQNTKSTAKPAGGKHVYHLTGDKHFGSGSGVLSYMITLAVPEGEALPDIFYMDLRDVQWDGSTGMKLLREWDGFGMMATQSHAFQFKDYPMSRIAWPAHALELAPLVTQLTACLFTSVIVGIVEVALQAARSKLAPKMEQLRAYEKTEWTKVVNECWTIQQVYQGMLNSIETYDNPLASVARGKLVIAELAEQALTGMSKVLGGGSFSKSAPFGQWGQDVRALGFLRPPWGLAFDNLFDLSWED